MARAEEVDLRFIRQKCKFSKNEVKYVGHVFGPHGLKPCKSKIQEIKIPVNKKELQRYLGMVNYLGKFIPNM